MTLSNKRILLTGAQGFIGSHLFHELKKQKAEVSTLVDYKGNPIDVRSWQSIQELGTKIEKVDILYHLAALMFAPYSFENPREIFEVNVLGTLNILELCRLQHIEKIVFASSYVYGCPQYLPVDEEHPLKPSNPYARSKVLGEDLCKAFNEDYDLKCTILRLFNVYGPEQSDTFLIPLILKQVAGGRIELMDPEPKRDFLYISDAIEAFIKAGEYVGAGFNVFNIGFGLSYSVNEIVHDVLEIFGRRAEVRYQYARRRNEVMDVVADIQKAKRELDWIPRVELKEGLRRYIEWYKA
jgi:UDP-glucose 4-epimerase